MGRRTQDRREQRGSGLLPGALRLLIGLRAHIEYHVAGKAYEGRDSNGAMNRFFYAEADGIPYPIYFGLGAANRLCARDPCVHISRNPCGRHIPNLASDVRL